MGAGQSEPTTAERQILQSVRDATYRDVAEALNRADVLLLCTGAGFSADSGLSLYKDIAQLDAYTKQDLTYRTICRPEWLEQDPSLFFGFWGTCFNDYRITEPHEGYSILRRWRDESFNETEAAHDIRQTLKEMKEDEPLSGEFGTWAAANLSSATESKFKMANSPYQVTGHPGAFFVYTSNVDAHSYDHFEPAEVRECHGNVEVWQCGKQPPCGTRTWGAPKRYFFEVDTDTMRTPSYGEKDAENTDGGHAAKAPADSAVAGHGRRAPNDGDDEEEDEQAEAEARFNGVSVAAKQNDSVEPSEDGDGVARAGRVKQTFGTRKKMLCKMPKMSSVPRCFQRGDLPRCPDCNGLARPAVLMFEDHFWLDDSWQEKRWVKWCYAVERVAKARVLQSRRRLRIMILEIGCGKDVPTVRGVAENSAAQFAQVADVSLVRVNPDYPLPDVPLPYALPQLRRYALCERGLTALRGVQTHYAEMRASQPEPVPFSHTVRGQRRALRNAKMAAALHGHSGVPTRDRSRSRSRSPTRQYDDEPQQTTCLYCKHADCEVASPRRPMDPYMSSVWASSGSPNAKKKGGDSQIQSCRACLAVFTQMLEMKQHKHHQTVRKLANLAKKDEDVWAAFLLARGVYKELRGEDIEEQALELPLPGEGDPDDESEEAFVAGRRKRSGQRSASVQGAQAPRTDRSQSRDGRSRRKFFLLPGLLALVALAICGPALTSFVSAPLAARSSSIVTVPSTPATFANGDAGTPARATGLARSAVERRPRKPTELDEQYGKPPPKEFPSVETGNDIFVVFGVLSIAFLAFFLYITVFRGLGDS